MIDTIKSAACQVMLAAFAAALAATGALADETCNSPYISSLIKGQESYVHVWTLGVTGLGDGSDKLVTIDADPASKHYGKVVSSVSVGGQGEAHHMGFTDDRKFLWAGNLNDSLLSLAAMTSNLNSQVQSNDQILTGISTLVVDTDNLVQGLKKHWLLRGAFPATNAAPRKAEKN